MSTAAAAEAGLLALLRHLDAEAYDFVPVTPATHARVLARGPGGETAGLRDIFGWNRAFRAEALPGPLLDLLRAGDVLAAEGDRFRSRVRVARLGAHLFLHSAFPTDDSRAVFFGPDTYRFVRFAETVLREQPGPIAHLVDMGAGSGAGAISLAGKVDGARLSLVDTNAEALRLARINAAFAGVTADFVEASTLASLSGAIDLVVANPPFMADPAGRAYRDGGDLIGARRSLDWAVDAARRLAPAGRMILYTGSAIVGGIDGLKTALEGALPPLGCALDYREIDVDIFGEELETEPYREVERIAAVGIVIRKAR